MTAKYNVPAELFKRALESTHEVCSEGCIHAKAMVANAKAIDEVIERAILTAANDGVPDPFLHIYSYGLHDGYRLRELMEQGD